MKELDPNIYLSQNWLIVDFETTNRDKGSALNKENELVLWVAYNGREYFSGTSDDIDRLLSYIRQADFICCHNAKFELQWLQRLGMQPGSVCVYDTLLGEYCLAGNRKWDLSLDGTALRYGIEGKESICSQMIKGGICPSEIDPQRLLGYCKKDVSVTHSIFLEQREKLRVNGLLPVFFTRCLTSLILADIEFNGMWLDKELVEEEYRKVLNESRTLLAALHEATGGINPKSPKQIGTFLYDVLGFDELTNYKKETVRTPSGARKTDEPTVSALVAKTEQQKEFLKLFRAYSPIKKALETLTKLKACCDAGKPLLFNFNQAVTGTHRLSSNGREFKVQAQNIDREFKRLFTVRDASWSVGDADAPQLEFRVAAHLGKDPVAAQDIRNHFDVHTYTARILLGKSKINKTERTDAKSSTFKPLYGGTSGTRAQRKYYKEFQIKYKGIYQTQTNWTYNVLKDKSLRTATGLVFYWPNVKLHDNDYISPKTEIFNYPVQSLATADIIPITLIYIWYGIKEADLRSFITNTVHDSISAEIAPGEEEAYSQIIKEAFTTKTFNYLKKVYGIEFSVPLGVAYNFDKHWAQGKNIEYDAELISNLVV